MLSACEVCNCDFRFLCSVSLSPSFSLAPATTHICKLYNNLAPRRLKEKVEPKLYPFVGTQSVTSTAVFKQILMSPRKNVKSFNTVTAFIIFPWIDFRHFDCSPVLASPNVFTNLCQQLCTDLWLTQTLTQESI
eukprot:m.246445 g.246445  ORF g.246445 m.246445 type:complete len:134 (+) comp33847_c2_seq22:1097-1498(+)